VKVHLSPAWQKQLSDDYAIESKVNAKRSKDNLGENEMDENLK
jgi:hypothetical protein